MDMSQLQKTDRDAHKAGREVSVGYMQWWQKLASSTQGYKSSYKRQNGLPVFLTAWLGECNLT